METLTGTAIKFGDNLDTDVMIPGKWLSLTDPKEAAIHAMEGIDANFPKKAEKGVIIVGGKNFGCGSSRELAPIALKYAGARCALAESFARIFFRNSINIGFPVIECPGISKVVKEGDQMEVELEKGKIIDLTQNITLQGSILPPLIMQILSDGGLIENVRKRLGNEDSSK